MPTLELAMDILSQLNIFFLPCSFWPEFCKLRSMLSVRFFLVLPVINNPIESNWYESSFQEPWLILPPKMIAGTQLLSSEGSVAFKWLKGFGEAEFK